MIIEDYNKEQLGVFMRAIVEVREHEWISRVNNIQHYHNLLNCYGIFGLYAPIDSIWPEKIMRTYFERVERWSKMK